MKAVRKYISLLLVYANCGTCEGVRSPNKLYFSPNLSLIHCADTYFSTKNPSTFFSSFTPSSTQSRDPHVGSSRMMEIVVSVVCKAGSMSASTYPIGALAV